MTFQNLALLKTDGKFLLNTQNLPIPLSPTNTIIKHIVADYGALVATATPDPANNIGGSRFYSLQGLPGFAIARMNNAPAQATFNFGGTAFAQSVPSGFSAWGAATVLSVNHGSVTLSGGNLTATTTSGAFDTAVQSTTSHSSGKWYFEMTVNALGSGGGPDVGIWNLVSPITGNDAVMGQAGNSIMCQATDGGIYFGLDGGVNDSSTTGMHLDNDIRDTLGAVFAAADVISVAVDFDHSHIWFRRNAGAWTCYGTSQAFEEFKHFGQTQTTQVLLFMEPGKYQCLSFDSTRPFAGIPKIQVWAYGASFLMPSNSLLVELGSHSGFWDGGPFPYPSGPTGETLAVRVNPVSPGAKWIDATYPLRTTGSLSLFPPNAWCCLDSQELQGHAGFPPNEYNCEYVQVSNVQGARIFLVSPVRGTYATGLPDRYHTATDGYDPGGPATLHRMFKSGRITPDNAWNAEISLNGLTLDGTGSSGTTGLNSGARNVYFTDLTFINASPNVSASKAFRMVRGHIDAFVEVDKTCETVEFDNVTFGSTVQIQSSSIQNATFNNCTWASGKALQGTAKTHTVNNCTIPGGITVGAIGYGQTKSATYTNSVINFVNNPTNFTDPATYTYSNGVFNSSPQGADAVVNCAVPGIAFYGGSGRNFALAFKVLSVTADAFNNTLINTDLPYASALPTLPGIFATPRLIWHPTQSISVSGCTGCPEIVELGDSYPQGKPLWSYTHRTAIGHVLPGIGPQQWGRLVSISINVTTPYSGPLSAPILSFTMLGIDNNFNLVSINSGGGTDIRINVKIAGERIITPTSITGAQSGDVLNPVGLPFPFTFIDGYTYTQDLTGDTGNPTPTVVLTIKTNQLSQFS